MFSTVYIRASTEIQYKMPGNLNNAKTRELIQTRHCVELKPPRDARKCVKRISQELTGTPPTGIPQQELLSRNSNRIPQREPSPKSPTAIPTNTPPSNRNPSNRNLHQKAQQQSPLTPPPPTGTPPTGTFTKKPNRTLQQEPSPKSPTAIPTSPPPPTETPPTGTFTKKP
ncbi:uncharacterized protein DKFZp434B061-like [Penaeus indicus]|uniref:uncharacterized protein DKFZp434B061-like n=1 Tax=Penaeus indicus TaxID=29960 RepID=UPI00300CEF54